MDGKYLKNCLVPGLKEDGSGMAKKPNPILIWILIAAIAFLAVTGLTGGKKDGTPGKKSVTSSENEVQNAEDTEKYLQNLEYRLTETLKKINGAGAVSVFISINSGGEKVLAMNRKEKNSRETDSEVSGASSLESEENVALGGQSAEQSPYVVQEKLPVPAGVLVVAEGARDEKVKFEIYEAVRALFGLSAHRIKVTY